MTYSYVTYATVAFDDMSIYCLGQQAWNVHYAGAVTQPAGGPPYTYGKATGNAVNGSGPFGDSVRNNANPAAIGPVIGNTSNYGWH